MCLIKVCGIFLFFISAATNDNQNNFAVIDSNQPTTVQKKKLF